MHGLAVSTAHLSIGTLLVWMLISAAALTGTLMIVVGMFEELGEIVRDAWPRSGRH
jgi:hypothetical protein